MLNNGMTQNKLEIVTIGAYGFSESEFYSALVNARIDTFCDLRQRRGMRGAKYSFVNNNHLQNQLSDLGIRYFHLKDLAPISEVRLKQKEADKNLGITKHYREALASEFISAYKEQCLSDFDADKFIKIIGTSAKVVALFCVEREPEACHRSIVAAEISRLLPCVSVRDIKP